MPDVEKAAALNGVWIRVGHAGWAVWATDVKSENVSVQLSAARVQLFHRLHATYPDFNSYAIRSTSVPLFV